MKDKLMSAANLPFATMSTGLDFVKQVWSNVDVPTGAAGPLAESLSKFITPTLDVAEIDKRLTDLRTVQKWLELNLNILKTTVQTLEVQRGTVAQLARLGLAVDEQGERGSLKELPKMAQDMAGKMLSPQQWWSMMSGPMAELMGQAAKAGVKTAVKASSKAANAAAGTATQTAGKAAKAARKAAAPARALAKTAAQRSSKKTAAKPAAKRIRAL
ncbi:MAG TPA: PhaM family polyhydroxyalkanoate granule multifunctional regulatory protein [Burkholderiaceae bacterium]|nr:PhaM family polyhydroxyalkanoate granule multifunctional regulatory protein [Burkholderiaceae bacterium]